MHMIMAKDRFDYDCLPLKDKLDRYADHHEPVGDFLQAVLSNDLQAACARADSSNLWVIPVYAAYIYNELPSQSHGSREKVAAWCSQQHIERRGAG